MLNKQLKRVHRFSGILIAGFILLHLFNHLFALGGPIANTQAQIIMLAGLFMAVCIILGLIGV